MGSFSVSCAMTGVTLANEPAVLIPLAPARWCDSGRRHPSAIGNTIIVSNEGAGALYGPLTLPLIGAVGDYGDLESFEEDANTRFLRGKLGDLDAFLETVTRGRFGNPRNPLFAKLAKRVSGQESAAYRKKLAWNGVLSGCWVSRAAWDTFSTGAWDEDGSSRYSVYDAGWLDPQNLCGLGFARGAGDEARARSILGNGPHDGDRYHTPWTHPELPELVIWCDENMSSEGTYRGKKINVKYHVHDLEMALNKLGLKLPDASLAWAKSTTVYHGKLLDARRERRRNAAMGRRHRMFLDAHTDGHWDLDEKATVTSGNGIEQTYYCKAPKGSRWRLVLRGPFADGEPTSWSVTHEPGDVPWSFSSGMKITPAVWNDINAAGWKPPRDRLQLGTTDTYLRQFSDETILLYGKHLLSDEMLPLVEATFTFMDNLYAANRILQPCASGWQCGNSPTQMRVAKLAEKLLSDREARRR